MKKVLVILAILGAAAACGGAGSTVANTSSYGPGLSNGSGGVPTKISGQAGGGATGGVNAPVGEVVSPIQGPQVIRQAQLSINVTSGSFGSKLAAVRGLVALEGGFISGTNAQASPVNPNDQIRSGVITFMVPSAKFDETIDQVSRLGNVQNEQISGNDVSAQYVDLKARLANQEAQRNAMLALLTKAQTISDIIAVQTQLGQITQQIEELKGQIAYIDQNTTYSTVSVAIMEAGAPVQSAPSDTWGFASALSEAAHNFVTTINYMVTGLGAIGPILVFLALGYLLWRRRGSPLPTRRA